MEPEKFIDRDRHFTDQERQRIYDFFVTNENNGMKEVAEAFGVSVYRIHNVINSFFVGKFETLPSKMNDEEYDD